MHADPVRFSRDERPVVIFDGLCNFCDGSVRFMIANDPGGHFAFAASQSASGIAALRAAGQPAAAPDGIVLIDGDRVYERSDAALRIAAGLRAPWSALAVLRAIPAGIRDPLYRWVARNRYRWFGRRAVCSVPAAAERARFLA